MDKTAIKTFAINSRNKLMEDVEYKMSLVGSEQKREIEKVIYLQVLDGAWREHLYQMDILKTGIGLRGYGQHNPVQEYQKEGFEMFDEMVEAIKQDTAKSLVALKIRTSAAPIERQQVAKVTGTSGGGEEESTRREPIRVGRKIGRNEPCPCGSGKKYKNCHGRPGAEPLEIKVK